MPSTREIRSNADIDAVLSAPLVVLLKYGTHCHISRTAREAVETFASRHPDATVCLLAVDQWSKTSAYAAERLAVPHESPQAFLLREGAILWRAEHYRIGADELANQFVSAASGAVSR